MFKDNSPPQEFISFVCYFWSLCCTSFTFQLFPCPLCSNNFQLHYILPFFYFTAWFGFLKSSCIIYANSAAFSSNIQDFLNHTANSIYCLLYLLSHNCSTGCFKWSTYRIFFGNYSKKKKKTFHVVLKKNFYV